jgi:hypothetical protein
LKTIIPTARFHAERLTRPTIGDASRDRRAVRILVAIRNADLLLAAASHRGSGCNLAIEQNSPKQGGGRGQNFVLRGCEGVGIGRVFHVCLVGGAPGVGNGVESSVPVAIYPSSNTLSAG